MRGKRTRRSMTALLVSAVILCAIAMPAAAEITISGYIDAAYYDIQGSGAGSVLPRNPQAAGTGNQINPALQAVGTTNGQTNGSGTFEVPEVDLFFTAPLTENITAYAELNSASLGNVGVPEAYIEFLNPFRIKEVNLNVGYFPPNFLLGNRGDDPTLRRNISQPMLNSYTGGNVVGVKAFGEVTNWFNYTVTYANSDPAGASSILNTDNGAGNGPNATIGNGLQTGAVNTSIGTLGRVATGGLTSDNNNSKTIMGRLGFTPFEMLEVGLSGSTGEYLTQNQDRTMWGVDVTFQYNPIRVTFEYLDVNEELLQTTAGATPFVDAEAEAWYVEAQLEVPLETRYFPNRKTLYLRYEEMEFSGPQTLGTSAGGNNVRIEYFKASAVTLAAAYDLFDNLVTKIEYQWNDEGPSGPVRAGGTRSDMGDVENDVFAASMVATF